MRKKALSSKVLSLFVSGTQPCKDTAILVFNNLHYTFDKYLTKIRLKLQFLDFIHQIVKQYADILTMKVGLGAACVVLINLL